MPSQNVMVALFDGIGESITPTANFTPASGFPLTAVRGVDMFHERLRTRDLSTAILTWDLGAPTPMDVFMLAGNNATVNTLRRWQAADDAAFTVGVVESGPTLTAAYNTALGYNLAAYRPPWGNPLIYVHPETVTKRYVRWHQLDAGNPYGYQEWAVARMGVGWQPLMDIDGDAHRLQSKYIGPPGAQKVLRGQALRFHALSKDEAYDLQSLCHSSLSDRRMLLITEPHDPRTWIHDAIWCVMESEFLREPIPGMSYSHRRYRVDINFREVDR